MSLPNSSNNGSLVKDALNSNSDNSSTSGSTTTPTTPTAPTAPTNATATTGATIATASISTPKKSYLTPATITTTKEDKVELPAIPIFQSMTFFILGLGFTESLQLKNQIKKYGGDVAFQINKNVHYLLTNKTEIEKKSSKLQSAIKLKSIDIISIDFISFCIEKRYFSHQDLNTYRLFDRDENNSDASSSGNGSGGHGSDNSIIDIKSKLQKLSIKDTNSTRAKSTNTLNQLDLIREKKKTCKLFISSTFLDMEKERECVALYVLPQIKEYCAERNIEFSHVDMRWGISSLEDLKKKNTIGTCLQEVSTSHYFVSLIGDRYGWCQGDQYQESFELGKIYYPWIEQYQGCSVTELEVLQATKHKSSITQSSLFFFKSSAASAALDLPKEDQQCLEKLKALKASITEQHSAQLGKFNDLVELATGMFTSVAKLIDRDYPQVGNGNQFLFNVDKHLSYSQSLLRVPYVNNNAAIMQSLNNFVLSHGGSHVVSSQQPFIIAGVPGYGRSTLIANWISRLPSMLDTKKTLLINVYVGITPASRNRYEIQKQLCLIIRSHYQINVPLSESFESMSEEMNYWFDIATRDGNKLVWVIDGVDKIETSLNESLKDLLVSFIPSKYTPNVKIVLSCYADNLPALLSIYDKEQMQSTHVGTLKGFESESDIIQFSKDYLSLYSKEMDLVQIEILKNFLPACESPLFLSSVLGELVTVGNYANIYQKMATLLSLEFALRLYTVIIGRLEIDTNYPTGLVSNVIQLINLSENGLYEEEILGILGIQSSNGLFSALRSIFGHGNYFSIYSPYLLMAVRFTYHQGKQDYSVPSSHEVKLLSMMRDYFVKQPCSQRKVDYMVRVLKSLNDKTTLREFLLDFENFNLMSKSQDMGRINIINLWTFVGYKSKLEIYHLYKDNLVKYKSYFPPLEELATTLYNLGCLMDCLSLYDQAFELLELSQDYHIQLYGDVHASVCSDITRLAFVNIKRSKFDTAEYQAEKSLVVSQSIYGKDQIGTFEQLVLNGLVQKKKTNYSRALEYYNDAKQTLFTFLAYKSASATATSPLLYNAKVADLYNHLGDIYRKLAQFDTALDFYNKTLDIYTNLRKPQHVSFYPLFKNLGLIEKKLGNYSKAQEYYESSLEIISIHLGKDHFEYGLVLCDIADNKRKQEDYTAAHDLYNQSLSILITKLGSENSIEIAEIYNDLGLIEKKLGHYQKAIDFYKKAITIGEKTLGRLHQKVSFFNQNLADVYRKLGDYKTSEQYFSKCLSSTQQHLGNDHPEVADILVSMGSIYKKQSKYQLAEREYKRAIIIITKAFGADHYKCGVYTNLLADVYRKLNNYDLAKNFYNKALNIIEKSLGKQHSEYGEVLYSMGLLQMSMTNFDQAIQLIKEAITIIEKELGKEHAKIGIYLNSLTETRIAQEMANPHCSLSTNVVELDSIRAMQDKSFAILIKDLGEHHPEVADLYTNRGEFEFRWGSHSKSREYFEKALEIIKIAFDESHIKYQTISDRIRYF
ncbi:hypothetical protein CYY_003103 [Polysphondylium violaceum]|uniref:BRCT domain-containing protein n=1 Tax=Polysphondylium violaceum TaxID=133409 RepID=A0A8J4V1M6_9MYCE|nr:hypothetical protein CYY_003103 [Polysphondylium violaceum]